MQSAKAGEDAFQMGMASMKAGDYAEAYCLWRPLAMRGHTEAAFHLGWLYANGNGLRVNVPKAVYWWGQAASRGHKEAMFALALAYTNGEGIKQDDAEAMRWYMKAAEYGHDDAKEIIKAKVRSRSEDVLPYLKTLLTKPWLGESVAINTTLANLRSGPGTDYGITGKAEQGARFLAVERNGKWIQIINPTDLSYAWVANWLVGDTEEKR
jgi:hypothetical protein